MNKTAIAAAAALLCFSQMPAHAVRTTTEGGTEIDFSSPIALGAEERRAKPRRRARAWRAGLCRAPYAQPGGSGQYQF